MIISAADFLRELRGRVSEEERKALEEGELPAVSRYNRATVLRMLCESGSPDGAVDTDRAGALETALQGYLDRYMADMPRGHKWIILSCLFLSVVAGEPMHPQAVTGWTREGERYYCRAREEQPGSICLWCVCRPLPGPAPEN